MDGWDKQGDASRQKRLIVALHDVAPPFEQEVRHQLAELRSVGVTRVVLKVVPNWHGTCPVYRYPSFLALLREEADAGSEIALHGFDHRASDSLCGPVHLRLRARLFAGNAAEFLALSPIGSRLAVTRGVDLLAGCGLPRPVTFCAPGWLISRGAREHLRPAGIRLVTGMFSVHDLSLGRTYPLAGIGQMGAGPRQESGVALLNVLVVRVWLPGQHTARLYLHPQNTGRASERVIALAGHLLRDGWRSATYREAYVNG